MEIDIIPFPIERLTQLDEPAPLAVLPIYSQMPADLQAKDFDATSDGRRKVIAFVPSLGSARFLKTVKCRHRNGYLVVKIFYIMMNN